MGRTDEELISKRNELMSRDVEQVAQITNYGVNIDEKRKIDLTFWAPTEQAARVLAEACERNGMQLGLVLGPGESEANRRWLVRCHISASVSFMTTKENLVTFLLFADKYECDYDGWGTAIVEAVAPSDTSNRK